jgi:hypothetical protein
VERASVRGLRELARDRRHDAARRAGDHEDRIRAERSLRVGDRLALHEADAPPQAVGVADLDRARVARGLLDEQVGDRGGLAAGREVDRLDHRLRTLAGERLGEAADGAAEHGGRTRLVVAVAAAEPRGGDQERIPVRLLLR